MARSTAYLQLSSHSVYYFRIRVPKACRKVIPQALIRRSLKTKCRRTAIVGSATLLQQFMELFLKAERGLSVDMSTMLSEDEKSLVGHQNDSQSIINPVDRSQKNHSPELSIVLVQYLKKQRLDGVSEKTLRDKKTIVELFIRIVGDKPIRDYKRKHTQGFKDKALKLPPCVQRKPKGTCE